MHVWIETFTRKRPSAYEVCRWPRAIVQRTTALRRTTGPCSKDPEPDGLSNTDELERSAGFQAVRTSDRVRMTFAMSRWFKPTGMHDMTVYLAKRVSKARCKVGIKR
ncbi:hypothetical protein BC936DRAFT_137108 [Jimgerdemannia flammicorona]|uniref:Uncharacterized protein n=1 Tax=Jimgerdemannia flammicorona TaxID=994334 RepID=A0A433CY30_9FUNG|nr:hypothetical protein BC936DRAFT_137108 [Jimgerdemannia flammicorona]